ncbi:MAG: hypothetical protein LBT62_00325 [Deltaproteobacteria bacterium]|jgi:hypothetical protein|nr:hypothetical protein [Deltaproteobacteria bacterium]
MTDVKSPVNDDVLLMAKKDDAIHNLFVLIDSFKTEDEFIQLNDIINLLTSYKKDVDSLLLRDKQTVSIDLFERLGQKYGAKFKDIVQKMLTSDINNIDEKALIEKKKLNIQRKE